MISSPHDLREGIEMISKKCPTCEVLLIKPLADIFELLPDDWLLQVKFITEHHEYFRDVSNIISSFLSNNRSTPSFNELYDVVRSLDTILAGTNSKFVLDN